MVEGGDVVLRTLSGCVVTQTTTHMQWPHDAVVLPPADEPSPRPVLAGASPYVIYAAEMEAHRIVSFISSASRNWEGPNALY